MNSLRSYEREKLADNHHLIEIVFFKPLKHLYEKIFTGQISRKYL